MRALVYERAVMTAIVEREHRARTRLALVRVGVVVVFEHTAVMMGGPRRWWCHSIHV